MSRDRRAPPPRGHGGGAPGGGHRKRHRRAPPAAEGPRITPQPRAGAGQGVPTLRGDEPGPGLWGTGPTRRPCIPRSPVPAVPAPCGAPVRHTGSPGFWGIPVDGTITNKLFGNNIKHKPKVCTESFIISKGQNWPQNCSQGREGTYSSPACSWLRPFHPVMLYFSPGGPPGWAARSLPCAGGCQNIHEDLCQPKKDRDASP